MKYVLPALLAVLALGLLSDASQARTGMYPAKTQATPPQKFIQKVANSNRFEIQSSQIALDKSKNDEIRRFAQRMIGDHTKIAGEFKATLQKANLPQPSDRLDAQDRAALTKLKGEKEAAFDRTYAAGQRKGHLQAVRLLETYSRTGGNPALKQLAAKTLPLIRKHLKMAEGLRAGRNLSARR
jgi:putative membrane protein